MSLEMTEQCYVSLSQDLTFAKTYIQLERKSLGDEFLLEWNIDPAIPTDQTRVPTMILQIPIENAVKHALRGKEGVKRLSGSIRRKENGSQLLICDNGAGFRPYINPHSANTGTGLKTLYQQSICSISEMRRKSFSPFFLPIVPVTQERRCRFLFPTSTGLNKRKPFFMGKAS